MPETNDTQPEVKTTKSRSKKTSDTHPGYTPRGKKTVKAQPSDNVVNVANEKLKKNTYPNPILKGEPTVKVYSKVRYNFVNLHVCLEAGKEVVISKARWEKALDRIPRLKRLIAMGVVKVG